MTFFERKIKIIARKAYSNQAHLAALITARNYINLNYSSAITLQELADKGCLTKYHFLRLYKRYYGQTPGQYLTDIRIERSKKLLREGMPVAAACYAVGFDSPSSFSTLFKCRTGKTPTQFQKAQFSQSPSVYICGTLLRIKN